MFLSIYKIRKRRYCFYYLYTYILNKIFNVLIRGMSIKMNQTKRWKFGPTERIFDRVWKKYPIHVYAKSLRKCVYKAKQCSYMSTLYGQVIYLRNGKNILLHIYFYGLQEILGISKNKMSNSQFWEVKRSFELK